MAHFSELHELELLLDRLPGSARVCVEGNVGHGPLQHPVYSISFGSKSVDAPVLAFIGGVHGLEKIGTRVVLAFLNTVTTALKWDRSLRQILDSTRLCFYPIVNPVGMAMSRRSNGRGIDLMRNSPVDAGKTPYWALHSGHRISAKLPWYRGKQGDDLEIEAALLHRFLMRDVLTSRFALTVDVHSGFGFVDRIWYPYAHTTHPFPNEPQVKRLSHLLDQTLPNHVYKLESQTSSYVLNGDLWDYYYMEHIEKNPECIFLPLTLELGSWSWIKKNPKQLLSGVGLFNPLLPHRTKRILRRHFPLCDFLLRATHSVDAWVDSAIELT